VSRCRGVKYGRKPRLDVSQIAHARKFIDEGAPYQYVVDFLHVGRSTLYRALI
jgi:DNA invertase Pin-like site-specific DNA recombinase